MDAVLFLIVVLLMIYPYYLAIRFLQLGCKAFRRYLRLTAPTYSYSEDDDSDDR